MKRAPRPIDEVADARRIVGARGCLFVVENREPAGSACSRVEIEAAGVQHFGGRHHAEPRSQLHGARIECAKNVREPVHVALADEIGLVDDDDIAKFDLLDQRFNDRPVFVARFVIDDDAAIRERIRRRVVAHEARRIHDGHERIEMRGAFFVVEREMLGDVHRIRRSRRFDHDCVEARLPRQFRDVLFERLQRIVVRAAPDHADARAMSIGTQRVGKRGFTGAGETRKHGDWQ